MAVKQIGGYVSINRILDKKESKNDAMIFVAGGKTVDRKIARANKKIAEKYEKEQAELKAGQHHPSIAKTLKNFAGKIIRKIGK